MNFVLQISWLISETRQAMDLQEFQKFQTNYYANFTESDVTLEDMVAEGDKVAFRACARALHTGEFNGMPASGNRIAVPCHRDGKDSRWKNRGMVELTGSPELDAADRRSPLRFRRKCEVDSYWGLSGSNNVGSERKR